MGGGFKAALTSVAFAQLLSSLGAILLLGFLYLRAIRRRPTPHRSFDDKRALQAPLLAEENKDAAREAQHEHEDSARIWAQCLLFILCSVLTLSEVLLSPSEGNSRTNAECWLALAECLGAASLVVRPEVSLGESPRPVLSVPVVVAQTTGSWFFVATFAFATTLPPCLAFTSHPGSGKTLEVIRIARVSLSGTSFLVAASLALSPPQLRRWPTPLTPEWTAGPISYLLFSWFTPVIRVGFGRQLNLEDIPDLAYDDTAAATFDRALRLAKAEVSNNCDEGGPQVDDRAIQLVLKNMGTMNLWQLGHHVSPWEFYTGAFFQITATISQFLPSVAINMILGCLSKGGGGGITGAGAVLLLALAPYLQGVSDTQRMARGKRVGCRVQALLNSLILSKALRVDPAAPNFSQGQAVNLMATDTRTLCRCYTFGHQAWSAPIQTILASLGLFWLLGWSAVGGVVFLGLAIVTTERLVRAMKTHQRALEACRDKRVSLLSEVLGAMRVVKMMCWETEFANRIQARRKDEVQIRQSKAPTMLLDKFILFFILPPFRSFI